MLTNSEIIISNIKDIIHEKTQRHENSIDLTVNKIMKLNNRGSLDFGGSEFKPSDVEEIPSEKKSTDDKYGWWNLEEGIYLLEFNEKLVKEHGLLQPLQRLIQTGSYIPTQIIEKEGEIQTILIVGKNGIDIKENARIAGLYQLK